MIGYEEALQRALALARSHRSAHPHAVGTVPLVEAAGRVLAGDIVAGADLPGFAHAAMDGYAVSFAGRDAAATGEAPWRVVGTVLAGQVAGRPLVAGEAMAIMTGAMVPDGTDAVVPVEQSRRDGDRVWLQAPLTAGSHIRAADDDVAAGTRLLADGAVLDAAALALLAAAGLDRVAVRPRIRVAVLVTGDELLAPGAERQPGRRHDSNGTLLGALVRGVGADLVRVDRCRDAPAALRAKLDAACAQAEVVVCSGGVSAGVADHLPSVVAGRGDLLFHKVAMKPGMPVLLARCGRCIVFGLPGNPVSAGVTFRVLVQPLLGALAGRADEGILRAWARLREPLHKRHRRTEFIRGRLEPANDGSLWVRAGPHQGSGALSSLVHNDVLVQLDPGEQAFAAGTVLPVLGWSAPWA